MFLSLAIGADDDCFTNLKLCVQAQGPWNWRCGGNNFSLLQRIGCTILFEGNMLVAKTAYRKKCLSN
ncbi:MAG: hypothetical protein CMH48_04040 [Muricauda sp.]|nr:hypothetical protein [Allomuricauda sp.]MBC29996.1 hypothetical protein [Allomuricauda sp.]|tara:strand:- start:1314 stop:1514 length:201 start_codon:yes stop_codon:yes gene_type:complete